MRHTLARAIRQVQPLEHHRGQRLCFQCPLPHYHPHQSSSRVFSSNTPIHSPGPYVRPGTWFSSLGQVDRESITKTGTPRTTAGRASPRASAKSRISGHVSLYEPTETEHVVGNGPAKTKSRSGARGFGLVSASDQAGSLKRRAHPSDNAIRLQEHQLKPEPPALRSSESVVERTIPRMKAEGKSESAIARSIEALPPQRDVPSPLRQNPPRQCDLEPTYDETTVSNPSIVTVPTTASRIVRAPTISPWKLYEDDAGVAEFKGRKVGWKNFDFENIGILHDPRQKGTIISTTPFFTIRACPLSKTPIKLPPFPPHLLRYRDRKEPKLVSFGYYSKKASMSKFAVLRNRAMRRLKMAVDMVVNQDVGIRDEDSEKGWKLISSNMVYLASINPDILPAKHEDIIHQVIIALKHIKAKALSDGGANKKPGQFGVQRKRR